jgi:hypothetical protein
MFRLLGVHPGPDITAAAAASLVDTGEPDGRRLLAEHRLVICACSGRLVSPTLPSGVRIGLTAFAGCRQWGNGSVFGAGQAALGERTAFAVRLDRANT